MRCPNCNKFVSFDEPNVESSDVEVSPTGDVMYTADIELCCAECGTQLKTGQVEPYETVIDHDVEKECELSAEIVMEEGNVRTEGSGRYVKTFYGVRADIKIVCTCGFETNLELTSHVQASAMDEVV